MTSQKAWVTLATNDTYSLGALVLAHSLKKAETSFKLVVLISSNVTHPMRGLLQGVYDEVIEVNLLDSGDVENLRLLARPELGVTFTKLHCWKLTQYEKCVFLDADTLVLQNCDELFEREELSAAPDVGWPDCFNSGVFVFKPSQETYEKLITFALAHGSFDGGDQGLLNMFFSDWATSDSSKRLPFLFNLSSAAIYSYLPAFKWYGKGVRIVHFIGNSKPWLQPFNSITRLVQSDSSISHLNNFVQYWWDIFCAKVHPYLSPEMTRLLLRSWITPQIPFKNNSYRNIHSRFNIKNQHDDVIVSETIHQTENESHFVFTDPWDEYQSSLVDNIENFDSNSKNEYLPPVVEEIRLVENQTYYPSKNTQNSPQNTSNYRDVVVVEGNKSANRVEFLDNFLSHQENVVKTNNPPFLNTQTYHSESRNTEIHRSFNSNYSDQSNHSNEPSFSPAVNTNYNHSPTVIDVLPEEKEISISKVDPNEEAGLAQSLSQMNLEEPTPEQLAQEDLRRRMDWEQGNIDYMGRDSFDNIWNKISASLSQVEGTQATENVPDDVSAVNTPVSSTQVTQTTAVSASPVSASAQPSQEPPLSATVIQVDTPKTESSLAATQPKETESSSSSDSTSLDPKETVKIETEMPVSQSQKEEPATASSISQSQSEPEPSCAKPNQIEKQKSQVDIEAEPKESVSSLSPSQKIEPSAEPESITQESPTPAPDSSTETSTADARSTATLNTATDTKSVPSVVDSTTAETKEAPTNVQADTTTAAQEPKSKQTPKSGGGKKK